MGRIRGLETNLSYRIGLRTFSEAESREAIGVPDAYHLLPEPGAGYLKVDTTVFARVRAAVVSGGYPPPAAVPKQVVPVLPFTSVNGIALTGVSTVESAAETEETVLDIVVRRLTG